MPPDKAGPPPKAGARSSWLYRALGVIATVRPGEAATALLMTLNVFTLLTSYYVLKVLRESLILLGGGAELKAYASGGIAILLLFVVPAFGYLASRVNRLRLLTVMQSIFIGCLVVFYLLARAEAPIGLAFYLWLGVYNVFVVSNFWSYANDIYSGEQGKRLFPILGVGASVGAILGSRVPVWVAGIDSNLLFLLVAAALGLSMVIYRIVDARESHEVDERQTVKVAKAEAKQPVEREGGFKLVISDKYLRSIALLVMISTVINTAGEYVISKMADDASKAHVAEKMKEYDAEHPATAAVPAAAVPAAAVPAAAGADPAPAPSTAPAPESDERAKHEKGLRKAYLDRFFSDYFSLVNLVSFLLQLLVVSRLLKLVGVRKALFVMPLVVALGWVGFLAVASLTMIRITKTAENSIDYSVQNTVRQALFLPTARASKYKGKAAIDTFFFRTADAIAGLGIVPIMVSLQLGVRAFAAVNLGLVLIWGVLAAVTGKIHDERTDERQARAAKGLRETVV
jgi:AAA family ATP:ADP antiporter